MTKAEIIRAKRMERMAKRKASLISSIPEQDTTTYAYKQEAKCYLDIANSVIEEPKEEPKEEDLQQIKQQLRASLTETKKFCKWCKKCHL